MSKVEFFKPFYIYGQKARYLSTHYFVNAGYIYLKGGINEAFARSANPHLQINGYKCVDVQKEQQ